MRQITKLESARGRMVLVALSFVVASIVVLYGCGETNNDRRQISQHTKNLAAKVKAAPDSAEGNAAVKELIEILNGDWSFAQSQACYVLDELGPLAAPAVPHLIRAAKTRDSFVQQDAVRGLRSIGPAAAPAVEFLIGLVESVVEKPNRNAPLRVLYAVEALGNIGEPALKAVPVLERASTSNDKFLAEEAQKSLDKLKRVSDAQSKEKRSAK